MNGEHYQDVTADRAIGRTGLEMAKAFAKSFYNSKEWKKTREYILIRDKYQCQHCGLPAEEVHHIIHLNPNNIWDKRITLNPRNLVSLCKECHFKEHEHKKSDTDSGEGFEFDSNGQLVRIK